MSGVRFNAGEILQMAEHIERNGAAFYRKAASIVSDDGAKKFLEELAEMEDVHETTFKEMRAGLSSAETDATVFDPAGETALYLQAMADGYVFDTKVAPGDKLSGDESMVDILKMAIGAEVDSIAFYVGMKEMVPADLGSGKVDDIIREEMRHIIVLTNELRAQ